jgi:hypothetical protein
MLFWQSLSCGLLSPSTVVEFILFKVLIHYVFGYNYSVKILNILFVYFKNNKKDDLYKENNIIQMLAAPIWASLDFPNVLTLFAL